MKPFCPITKGKKGQPISVATAFSLGCRCTLCVSEDKSWRPQYNSKWKRKKYKEDPTRFIADVKRYTKKHNARVMEKRRKYVELNREKVLQGLREWREKNPEYGRLANARRRAKIQGALTPGREVEVKEWRVFLEDLKAWWKLQDVVTHIDHIVPLSRGGLETPENLRLISQSHNLMKRNRLDSELSFQIKVLSPSWEEWQQS